MRLLRFKTMLLKLSQETNKNKIRNWAYKSMSYNVVYCIKSNYKSDFSLSTY